MSIRCGAREHNTAALADARLRRSRVYARAAACLMMSVCSLGFQARVNMPRYAQLLKTIGPMAVMLLGSAAAGAQAPQPEPQQFEVTPFVGYRLGGGFKLNDTDQHISLADHQAFAAAVDLRADQDTQYELFYSRESTTLRGAGFAPVGTVVEYLQVGGTVAFDQPNVLRPYFGGGIGVARLSPDLAVGHDDTRLSLSLSLGLRAPLGSHLALRFEARGFFTPVNTDTAVFCRSDQGDALCRIRVRGSTFFQGDFLAGLAFTF
jgi:opacity protein-like surface antigen